MKSSILIRSIFSKLIDCVEVNKIKCPYKKVNVFIIKSYWENYLFYYLKGIIHLTNCKLSDISLPDVWTSDTKFKVLLKTTAKLPSNRWHDVWTCEVLGLYRGETGKLFD